MKPSPEEAHWRVELERLIVLYKVTAPGDSFLVVARRVLTGDERMPTDDTQVNRLKYWVGHGQRHWDKHYSPNAENLPEGKTP